MSNADHQPRLAKLHLWEFQWVRDLLVVFSVIGVLSLGYAISYVTIPLLLAFGLAYLMEPLVALCVRVLHLSRAAAVSVILIASMLALVGAGSLIVPLVASQSRAIMDSAKQGRFSGLVDKVQNLVPSAYGAEISKGRQWFSINVLGESEADTPAKGGEATGAVVVPGAAASKDAPRVVPLVEGGSIPAVTPEAGASTERAGPALAVVATDDTAWGIEEFLGTGAKAALVTLRTVFELLFAALLVPFYFWFLSVSFPTAIKSMEEMIPKASRPSVLRLVASMDSAVAGFVRVRILIAFAMGIMFAIGWWICGVPFAVTLGLFAGILSVVPYLGFIIVPLAVMLLATAQLGLPEAQRIVWWWIPLGPLTVFVAVQSIEGYLLTPYFAARTTKLGPVTVFVAILAGASLAGVYGMLLAIPAAACIRILLMELWLPRLREWVEGRRADPLPLE
ncbi:MAG: AI-2E family transporter [Phycisphaerales bacterium]|nr:AI-2E family transporter [Phycisphaerales bacterium]